MEMKKLDYILVPVGLFVMTAYHLWVLHTIYTRPRRTVYGINSINRQIWVRFMMQDPANNGSLAIQTLSYYMTVATVMATTAIVLGTLITALMTEISLDHKTIIIGNTTEVCLFFKLIMTAVCFLLAFLFGLLSSRYYCHSIMVINMPTTVDNRAFAMNYVTWVLERGAMFWSMGMRAYYFSMPLSLWAFGPIPMIVSCFALVGMLYILDMHSNPSPTWMLL